MILYRFSPKQFSNNISGEGAKLFGGRWNSIGIPVVYTSMQISLALLELLIHQASIETINRNCLIEINVLKFDKLVHVIEASQLKANWQYDIQYCNFIGDEFIKQKKFLFLQVPSAIIPEEYNILINPLHKDFNSISIQSIKTFVFDVRLFKK